MCPLSVGNGYDLVDECVENDFHRLTFQQFTGIEVNPFRLIVEQLAVELPDLVEQVVDLNSDLFDFLPFLFYSRK